MASQDEVDVCESWEDMDEIGLDQKIKLMSSLVPANALKSCKVTNVIVEDNACIGSQCMMPEPAIRILRRPSSLSSGQLNGENRARPVKTLQQRQKEYEEARLRILGEARSPEDVIDDNLTRLQDKLQANNLNDCQNHKEKNYNNDNNSKGKERKVLVRLPPGSTSSAENSPSFEESKALCVQGVKLAEEGKLEDALELMSRAVLAAPERAGAYNDRAQLLRLMARDDVINEVLAFVNNKISVMDDERWCNVNSRRGAYVASFECDSGPSGLPIDCNEGLISEYEHNILENNEGSSKKVELRDSTTMTQIAGQLIESLASRPPQPEACPSRVHSAGPRHPSSQLQVNPAASTELLVTQLDTAVGPTLDINVSGPIACKQKSLAEIVREGKWKTQAPSDQWVRVQSRRSRNGFVGKRGKAIPEPGSNFIAAETKVPMYIYNVAKGVSVCDISTYIVKKTNIDVKVEKMDMKLAKDYESYKIFVPKHSLKMFLSDDFWPKG
ncbi:unnamed protein product, partial [Leptidea sinapis]